VLKPNLVTKKFEQAVIQGLASDKVNCTLRNRQHILIGQVMTLLQGHGDTAHNV